VSGGGTLTLAALRREQTNELLDRMAGSTDWTVAATLRQGNLAWTLTSSMKGVSVDLPAPLGKASADTMPLKIDRREDAQPGIDFITASYGGVAQLVARPPRRRQGDHRRSRAAFARQGESSGAMPNARSDPASGCAPSFPSSTSTTGSPCCAGIRGTST
jgi:uncharacterized protein YhdP